MYTEEHFPDWEDKNTIPVPKFVIQTSKRKFRNGNGRMVTTVLAIECMQEDALYLKVIISKAYTSKQLQYGIFVPTGVHW
eukprot:15342299-Ditylum_brightwellii.AAC.2